jgi:hypothetical protein
MPTRLPSSRYGNSPSTFNGKIKTPFFRWNGKVSQSAVGWFVAALIVLALIRFGIMIGAVVVIVINILDIIAVGANFWNVLWIVVASLFLLFAVFSKND